MKQRYCVGVTRAAAASIMPCLALLCVPTMSVAAAPSDSRPEADRASALLARGAGHGQPQGEPSPAVNRLIDIVVAAVVLLLSAPLVVLLALAIVLESPGGVFYRAERVRRASGVSAS